MVFEETKPWPWSERDESEENIESIFSILDTTATRADVEQTEPENETEQNTPRTPGAQSSSAQIYDTEENSDNYDDTNSRRKYRPLSEIYENTEVVEPEEELYLMGTEEPSSYRQAANDNEWRLAMEKEMDSIERNGTWKLSEPPEEQKVIGLKWIYKLKRDASGNVVKHKVRLVAKGYSHRSNEWILKRTLPR